MYESSRRFFIAKYALGTLASQIPFNLFAHRTQPSDMHLSMMPIDHMRKSDEHEDITGDQPHPVHKVLWDVPALRAKLSDTQITVEQHSLVIIGAGIAGLTSAFMLNE